MELDTGNLVNSPTYSFPQALWDPCLSCCASAPHKLLLPHSRGVDGGRYGPYVPAAPGQIPCGVSET